MRSLKAFGLIAACGSGYRRSSFRRADIKNPPPNQLRIGDAVGRTGGKDLLATTPCFYLQLAA
ncbi:hypothetical protein BK635_13925 [Pseudomonas chlororaphis]|nr:hypothetical protein BK636_11715 [Pseudomonas chlororaphis]ROL85198.1 hypothetical protein BK637_19430 [Pseudomonas chlororaphis]RON81980.1 hypothetical protein BK635_13925 [Pseudomonas chlororaphis]